MTVNKDPLACCARCGRPWQEHFTSSQLPGRYCDRNRLANFLYPQPSTPQAPHRSPEDDDRSYKAGPALEGVSLRVDPSGLAPSSPAVSQDSTSTSPARDAGEGDPDERLEELVENLHQQVEFGQYCEKLVREFVASDRSRLVEALAQEKALALRYAEAMMERDEKIDHLERELEQYRTSIAVDNSTAHAKIYTR